MSKFTLNDSFTKTNRTGKTKRWLGWVAFCGVLLLGQIGFAFLMPNLKEASNNELVSTETQTEYATTNNNTMQVVSTNASVDALAECSQISSSSSLNGGWLLGGTDNQELAGDFVVAAGTTFDFETLKVSVNTASTTSFDVFIWSDNNNLPNAVLYTITGVTSTNPVLTSGAYYMHTLDISSENISFAPMSDTRYWVQVTTTGATSWERRYNDGALGVNDAYRQNSGAWNTIFTTVVADQYNLVYEVIGECTGCPTSFGLTATQASTESATINWDNFSGNLSDIQWGAAGFALGSGTIVTGLTPPYTITGLTLDAEYDVYIKCTDGNDWVGPVSFTILDVILGCDIVLNIGYTSWGDAVTWQLLDGSGTAVLSGGPYGGSSGGYSDTQTTTFLNPPYTLNIVSTLGDNGAVYSITVGGDQDISGSSFGNFNISVPLNATSCPTCPAPTGLSVDNITFTSADLSWTGGGGDYELEWGLSGFAQGTGTMISPATSPVELTELTGQTSYQFYVREYCGVDDGYSVWAGPYTFYTDYCQASVQWTGDSINSVETSGAIINISNTANGTSPNGYGNFTSYAVQHFAEGEMELTVTTDWNMNVNMWIDWNNNFVFDADELVYQGTDEQQVHTALITVPAGTPLGNYRIRVRAGYLWSTNIVPCGQSNYGEVEDYTLTVITPPTCMPPTQLGANINSLTEAELYWTSPGTLFEVEYGLQGFTLGTGTLVDNITTNSTTLSTLTQNTFYQYYVRRDCGDGDLSPWAGPFKFYTNYCESTTQWEWDYINSFSTTMAITNITNNNTGFSYPNGYGDYTDMAVSHFETGEVNFTVGTQSYLGVNIWVDWNNNMVFEESEKVYASGFMSNGPFTGTFTVPAGQAVGDYRMRVRGSNDGSNPLPCGMINYGETEDYTFTVIPTPTCMPPTQLGANINSLTEAELFWTSPGTLFEVEYGLQGFTLGTGTLVDNITTNSTTLSTLTQNTYYQYYIRRDCGDGDLSPWTGPYTFYTNYCESTTQWEWDYINSFSTSGAITNFSNNNTGFSYPNGYGDYTDMAVSHFETGEVSFTLETPSWLGVNIWVDWNNNMVFEESEKVYTSGDFTTNGPFTGMFSVPVGQPVGDYRMRVRGSNDSGNPSPCGMINYGETEDYTFTVIPTPTCMPPTQLGANINSLTEAELFWTSPGTLFEVEYGLQGFTLGTGTLVDNITTNSTTLSTLTQNTYYQYYVRRDCGDGDLSPWTGPYTFYTNYCPVSVQWTGDSIDSVESSGAIINISNTANGTSPNGYGDFTSYAIQHFADGEMELTVTTQWEMNVNMWIDWNNNMVFDAGELVYEGLTQQNIHTALITVPVGTPLGNYRIRVRAGYLWNTNIVPCGQSNYGEVEDYTLTVITPPTCMPPTQLGANINSLTEAELYWTSPGTLFEVEYGLQGFTLGTGTLVDNITTNSTTLSTLTQNTYYHYYVRRDCGDGDLSPWAGPFKFYTNYCPVSVQWTGDSIDSVESSGAIINISNTANGTSPNGYGDFTSYAIQHFADGEMELTVTTQWEMNVNMWIDWNNNMVFDAGELVYEGLTQQNVHTALILIPAGTPLGNYRIRVRAGYLWNTSIVPCGQSNYGEVEDYTLTVITPPTCMPPTQLGANINSLTEAELYWTSPGTLFEVEYGLQGFTLGTGTLVDNITTNSTTVSGLAENTYYHYYVRRDCGDGDLSPWAGPFKFYTNYCESISQNQWDYITSFVTSGGIPFDISNTNSGASPNGYGNFTSMSVHHFETGQVDFTIGTTWNGLSVNMWIDWNNNMVFEEDELVASTYTGSFLIPLGTPVGDYRIRIRAGSANPCGTINSGETEDYTLTVITPPDCLPPFVPIAANISATAVSLSWQADGDVFDIEYGPTGFTPGTGILIEGVGNPYILGPLVGGQSYDYYVRQDCNADEDGYSTWNGPVTFVPGVFEGNIPTLLNANPQVEDVACATSFAIDVPPGQFLASLTVSYTMTSSSPALDSHQRSVLYSSTLGMGEPQVATHPDPQNYPGLGFYNRNVDFANGATGTIEFELKAWRTEGGSGCGTDLVYVEDGSWVLNATFEDIPSCPNPPSDLGYTNIMEDSVDLIWTSEETGTFQVNWGAIGFNPATTGTTISDINGYSHTLSGLDSSIQYEFYVRRDCSTDDGEDFGEWVGPVRFNSGHCIPYATQGFYFNTFVTTNAAENVTYSYTFVPPLGTGYVNTDLMITEDAGTSFDFTSSYVGGASGLRIWIDWNKNFVFEDDEQVYFLASASGNKSGTITIPENAINGEYRMRARVQSGGTSNPSACGLIGAGEALDFTLKVQGGVSNVPDFNSFGFRYYPNPVSEQLYLSANAPISDVVIVNMLGQQVNAPANSDNTNVDMSGLPTGNYLIKVTIEGVSKTLKVVKK